MTTGFDIETDYGLFVEDIPDKKKPAPPANKKKAQLQIKKRPKRIDSAQRQSATSLESGMTSRSNFRTTGSDSKKFSSERQGDSGSQKIRTLEENKDTLKPGQKLVNGNIVSKKKDRELYVKQTQPLSETREKSLNQFYKQRASMY